MTTPAHSPSSTQLYLRLLREVMPHWRVLLLVLFASQIAAATEPVVAWLMGPLINVNFSAGHSLPPVLAKFAASVQGFFGQPIAAGRTHPIVLPFLIVSVFFIRALANLISDYSSAWLANQLVAGLRDKMFRHALQLPIPYFDYTPSSKVMTRIVSNVNNVTQAGVNILTVVLKDTLTIIYMLWLMFSIDWRLTLMCLFVLPIAALSVRLVGVRLRGLNRQQQSAMARFLELIQESILNIRIVKLFGGDRYEGKRFAQATHRVRRLSIKQTLASSGNSALLQVLIAIALALVIYYASLRSAQGALSAGAFMSFITALLMLTQPVQRLSRVNESLQKGLAAAESVFGFLDEPAEKTLQTSHAALPARALGQVVFEGVSLRYAQGETDALNAISLTIAPGETVAVVGLSGSGKTTLANILPRFYEPHTGRILLDGVVLSDWPLPQLRAQIGVVSQDVALFNDTVAANIAYGQPDLQRADIEAAAEAAYASEFIRALPQGFDTVIGERGTRLSGGQKQRLAIARALLKNAPILILDEATSALDSESERYVQIALERLMENRTTLVIAHRLSTIERADRIIVMEAGQIIEQGHHQDLLSAGGAYAKLWQLQFSAARDTDRASA